LGAMGLISFRGAVRMWREKPRAERNNADRDARPPWLVAGSLPTGLCVLSLAIAFPLSYGVQSKDGFVADTCFIAGGLFFIIAAVTAVILVYVVVLLFFERPLPRILIPPSRRVNQ
jgi:hypothetical protein